MILKYYSKNFNNYKIIEKLLEHNNKIKAQTSRLLKEDKENEDLENNNKVKLINTVDDNDLIQDSNISEKDDNYRCWHMSSFMYSSSVQQSL